MCMCIKEKETENATQRTRVCRTNIQTASNRLRQNEQREFWISVGMGMGMITMSASPLQMRETSNHKCACDTRSLGQLAEWSDDARHEWTVKSLCEKLVWDERRVIVDATIERIYLISRHGGAPQSPRQKRTLSERGQGLRRKSGDVMIGR